MTAPAPAPPRNHRNTVGIGILYMLASVLGLSLLNVLVKLLAARYAIAEIAFFRSLFALPPALAMVLAGGGWATLRTARLGAHAGRAAVGLTAMTLMFWSFALLPLADAVAIGFSAPLFLTALSMPLLGEPVGPWRWLAVSAGFAGVLIMVKPGTAMLTIGAAVGIASAVAYALAVISIRRLTRTEPPGTIVFYFTLFSTALTAPALPVVWVMPDRGDWGLMMLTGLIGGMTQHLATRAYAAAPAAVIGPLNYSALLWATLFGWLIWGQLPTPAVAVGAAMVIASGLIVAWHGTR